jgi:hypothetical protein
VVDSWVNADCSTPKNYQRLLNSKIPPAPFARPFLSTPQELAILYTLEHTARIHDVKFAQRVDASGEVVLVAAEDKATTVYEVHPGANSLLRPTARFVGHGNRYGLDLLVTIPYSSRAASRRLTRQGLLFPPLRCGIQRPF